MGGGASYLCSFGLYCLFHYIVLFEAPTAFHVARHGFLGVV